MRLLDHVSIIVRDLDRARPFYEAVMAALGVLKVHTQTSVALGSRAVCRYAAGRRMCTSRCGNGIVMPLASQVCLKRMVSSKRSGQ